MEDVFNKRKIPEFGTIDRVNFDVGNIVAFILADKKPFKYVIPKDFVRVVIPFLPYEFEGPPYYRETIVFLAYWKLSELAEMTHLLDNLMKEMDEDFVEDETPLGKNLIAK